MLQCWKFQLTVSPKIQYKTVLKCWLHKIGEIDYQHLALCFIIPWKKKLPFLKHVENEYEILVKNFTYLIEPVFDKTIIEIPSNVHFQILCNLIIFSLFDTAISPLIALIIKHWWPFQISNVLLVLL